MDTLLPLARKVGEKLKARKETVGVIHSNAAPFLPKVATPAPPPAIVLASDTCVCGSAYPSGVGVRRGSRSSPIAKPVTFPAFVPSGLAIGLVGAPLPSPQRQSSLAIGPDAIGPDAIGTTE